jgi:hypothetical protein
MTLTSKIQNQSSYQISTLESIKNLSYGGTRLHICSRVRKKRPFFVSQMQIIYRQVSFEIGHNGAGTKPWAVTLVDKMY